MTITLPPGWSQIACPYAFPVAWDTIRVVKGLFYYDNGQYIPNIRTLMPWEGYFVRNDSGRSLTLSIPPVEAPPSVPRVATPTASEPNDYVLQLSARGVDFEDTYNYIGFLNGASVGEDRFDIPEPPLIGDFVSLSIVNNGERYIGDFRPKNESGQEWDLQLSSTIPNQRISVFMTESGILPVGFGVYLLDKDEFNAVPLNERRFSIQIGNESMMRRLHLIIGTESFASEHAGGIPLIPIEYGLDQNYPNPFNPTTTIRYQISKRTDVILELYNILGQHIRTLVRGEQMTGSYTILWDGRNGEGQQVASGIYVYRLIAGEFIASRKLVFLQ